jgi:phosphate transport system substrate-binding protein
LLQNAAGKFPQPEEDAFKAAAANAQWDKSFYQILTNQQGDGAWPITGATFILMHKTQDKPAQAATVLRFFDWAYKNGDKTSSDLDYVPMPASVKTAITKQWAASVKDSAGKAIAVE